MFSIGKDRKGRDIYETHGSYCKLLFRNYPGICFRENTSVDMCASITHTYTQDHALWF